MVEPAASIHRNLPVKVLLEGAQELMGRENLQKAIDMIPISDGNHLAVRNQAAHSVIVPIEELHLNGFQPVSFLQTLEEMYGTLGGRGLALRIGRSAFKNALSQYDELAELRSMAFRLQPAPVRLWQGLQSLARVYAQQCQDIVQVTDQGSFWEWRSENCPICSGVVSDSPCCYLLVGFLQEFMSWAGGGRFYRVTETACRSAGNSACVFRIDKKPLD